MPATKRPSPVRSLIMLNAALLLALVGVTVVPAADAQQARVRGQHSMISARVQGSTSAGIVIADSNNMELLVTTWDDSRKTLNFVGFRDMRVDAANTQARPR